MKPPYIASVIIVFSQFMGAQAHAQPNAEQLYQAAVYKEEVQGELVQAITIFEQIAGEYPGNRSLSAKALLHSGLCYEKLGRQDAQKAYQRILRDYADQEEVAAEARTRLFDLERSAAAEPRGIIVRRVWSDSDTDNCGAPSPDGRYLSCVDWATGDLAIYELATGKKQRLTNKGSWDDSDNYAFTSKWAPDSRHIVYGWYDSGWGSYELRVISLDDSKPRTLYHNEETAYVEPIAWSSDGKHILASLNKKDGTDQIVLIAAEDGSSRVLKTDSFKDVALSPDGRYIAYDFSSSGNDSSNSDIALLPVDGSDEMPLVAHPANDWVLGWAPDGKGILFGSDRTGTSDAYMLPVAHGKPQGEPVFIKNGMGPALAMGFTQKGSFFYSYSNLMTDVYTATLDPETGKVLDPPKKLIESFEGRNASPDYSPDGKYLAYVSLRSASSGFFVPAGGNRLCILSLETGKVNEYLTTFKWLSSPHWSPDSRSILVTGWHDNTHGIYLFDAQTGDFKPVLILADSTNETFMTFQWSRDGKSVLYGSKNWNTKIIRIMIRDIASGAEKDLYRQPVTDVKISISPNGQWLALLTATENMKIRIINIMPVTGGELREVCRWEQPNTPNHSPAWSVDGKYILFAKARAKTSEASADNTQEDFLWNLWRVPREGGEPRNLGLEMVYFINLSVHPDGRHIAFASRGSARRFVEIWVMENFLP